MTVALIFDEATAAQLQGINMELLDKYNELREQVFAYFGYVEDWRALR